MEKDEKLLWEMFCMTGEPRYYSMYIRNKKAKSTGSKDEFDKLD